MADERTGYYTDQLQRGEEYQDFISHKLYSLGLPIVSYTTQSGQYEYGENRAGIEIKLDQNVNGLNGNNATGNLWLETHEKTKPENQKYIESGILRDDNSWAYLIGDYSECWWFSKKILKQMLFAPNGQSVKQSLPSGWSYIENGMKTSWGFLVPRTEADRWCIRYTLFEEKKPDYSKMTAEEDPIPF